MQDDVLPAAAPAAAVPRFWRPRTYTAEEQEVMRELNLRSLPNVLHITLRTGAARWRVKLSAEGLQKRTRELCGKLSPSSSARDCERQLEKCLLGLFEWLLDAA
jgi:hypothetical protein